MNVQAPVSGFSQAQYEVVNMLSCVNRPADIVALKAMLVQFLDSRLQSEIDDLYSDGTLNDERMAELASSHLRTPYAAAR